MWSNWLKANAFWRFFVPESQEASVERYRRWYARLIRLYSKPFHRQFGQAMEQTFGDMLRDRMQQQKPLGIFTLQIFSETVVCMMKDRSQNFLERNKDFSGVFLGTACILLIPLISMQFTSEVNWQIGDFIVAAIMLSGVGITYKLIARKRITVIYKCALGLALFAGIFLIWANLAVGLIGNEDNPANFMYLGVLATLIVGSLWCKFRPFGMSRTLFAGALAQITVALFAYFLGYYKIPGDSLMVFINLNSFFVVLFTLSGVLFLQAHRSQSVSPS